jgi:tetratricopeptide (TPR) repeat protein
MSNSRPDLFIILNPWQGMMSAMVYSVVQDLNMPPVLVWDPDTLKSYFKLKALSTQVRDAASELDGLLPIGFAEFLKQIERRQAFYEHAAQEPKDLVTHFQPRRLLVLTERLPTPSFWSVVPEDTEIHILAWEAHRETIEQSIKEAPIEKLNHSLKFVDSFTDLFAQLWQTLRQTPFPERTEAILAGDTAQELLTGIYYAKKEGIPLLVGRIFSEQQSLMIAKVIIEGKQPDELIQPIQHYEPIRKAKLCELPRFNCILESVGSLNFVASIVHTFEQQGQIILCEPPTIEAIEEAELSVKRISELIMSESMDYAHQELNHLSKLVSNQIPRYIHDILEEFPEIPVQIIGTPFPYSISKTSDGTKYWAEIYTLAFFPLFQASKIFLRNFKGSGDENAYHAGLFALVDSLSPQNKTEAQSVVNSLRTSGSYCINLQEQSANILNVKSMLTYIPLDVCLFVGHGTEKAIALNDGFLSSDEIRTLPLNGGPLIINNSCLSWTGPGRAFIEGRARGFIGTYWTIENNVAVDIAQDLFTQLFEGKPISKALQITIEHGNQSLTHLAYVFVGLYDTILPIRQTSNAEEPVDLPWVKIFEGARIAVLHRHDPRSAGALWRLTPSNEELQEDIDKNRFSPFMASTLALAQFDFYRGMSTYDERITDDFLLEEGVKAVEIIQYGGTERQLYLALSALGHIYLRRGDLEKAEECFLKALEIERRLGHRRDEAGELGNLGILYDSAKNFTKALEYHQQALAINKETNNTYDWVLDLENIALDYLELNDLSLSLRYAQEALAIYHRIVDVPTQRLLFCIRFAERLLREGQHTHAKDYIDVSLQELFDKWRESEYKLTIFETSLMIKALNIRADYFSSYVQNLNAAEADYRLAGKMAWRAQLFPEYFSIEFKLASILKRMYRVRDATHLVEELKVEIHNLRSNIDAEMYEAISRGLQALSESESSEGEE